MLRLRRARWSRARLIGVLTLTIGVLTSTGIATGWWWTDLQARHTAHRLADQATRSWTALDHPPAPVAGPAGGSRIAASRAPLPIAGPVIAVVQAPRLGADWRMPVQLGTGTQVLREGLGLYTGSPQPGSIGNVALAGHRTTWGAPLKHLDKIRAGDLIRVWTARGRFDYRVTGGGVTLPSDVSVIAPTVAPGTAMLTLTTCNPEFSARQRLYVHAVLADSVLRTATPLRKPVHSSGVSAASGSSAGRR